MIPILQVIGLFLAVIFVVFLIGHLLFVRSLKRAEWYNTFVYEFRTSECPHQQNIPLNETTWTMDLVPRRIKQATADPNASPLKKYRVEKKLTCTSCKNRHWFYINNRETFNQTVRNLRMEFFLRTFVAACLSSLMLVYAIEYLF